MTMNIGPEKPPLIVEPIHDPFAPATDPEAPTPAPEPLEEPVPAGRPDES
jgi:hypothetical protein